MRRMVIPSADGKVTEASFALSSTDEASPLRSLSVFESERTTLEQCVAAMSEAKRLQKTLCGCLDVSSVRSLRPDPNSPVYPDLDVVWDPLEERFPGSDGHSGITGLAKPTGLDHGSTMYRSLRVQLARMANAHGQTRLV